MKKKTAVGVAVLCLAAVVLCLIQRHVSVPESAEPLGRAPKIYPDYIGTTVPVNIAPLNFAIEEEGAAFVTVAEGTAPDAGKIVVKGREARFHEKAWRELLEKNAGGKIAFKVWIKSADGRRWRVAEQFDVDVSPDPIDGWLVCRMLAPGYDYGGWITLEQRSLESFEKRVLFDNRSTGACVNCHSFQNRKTEKYSIHYRVGRGLPGGGTVVALDGELKKISGRIEAINGRCSYPSWRPTGDLVVFSSNKTFQALHSMSTQKIEVVDSESDLVLVDVRKNKATVITNTLDEFETFPQWSPDGNWLYYCSAEAKLDAGLDAPTTRAEEAAEKIALFRYNIYRRPFDESSMTFGEPELVVDARAQERSALHPRISPDGKFLVYTRTESGTFPLWRPEADLWIKDLASGEERALDGANGRFAESYHSWDSSGRWLAFSSRREEGQYARVYFTHVDSEGRATKAFVLPQKDPYSNRKNMRAFNVPELISEPVRESRRDIFSVVTGETEDTQ